MWPNYLVNVGGIVKDHTSRVATSRYKLETGGRVKYKKNEASVDVIERLSAKGTVLCADIDGHIQMRAYLSGIPECKSELTNKRVIDKGTAGNRGN